MSDFDDTAVFDVVPDWGFESDPNIDVSVADLANGFERRNRNWLRPLHTFTVSIGEDSPRLEEEVADVYAWYMAMGGAECGFKLRDYTEYLTCVPGAVYAHTDQPTIVIDSTHRQLCKVYTKGARSQTREIYKPQNDSEIPIKIGVGGTLTPSGWTLDTATGILTFSSPPGGTVTWGGAFYVPVRFASTLPRSAKAFRLQGCTFMLKELRIKAPA